MPITQLQRERRQKYLGSSDMPVVMGVCPYKRRTAADVYWSKVSELPEERPEQCKETGNWIEDALLSWASSELGIAIVRNQFRVAHDGDGAGIFAANCDALAKDRAEGVEAKFANGKMAERYGEPGTGEVPDDIVVQVQHQMYCADLERVWVPVAVPSEWKIDRRMYCVTRDDDFIQMISKYGRNWWVKHVVGRCPPNGCDVPPIDVLKATDRLQGKAIDLDAGVMELVEERERLKAEGKDIEGALEGIDARILQALGDAEAGHLPDGRMVTYFEYGRTTFDKGLLQREHPDIYAKCCGRSTYRTLYIKAPKKRAKSA